MLVWDIPDGMWRIFVFYNTRNGGGRPHYINMIDKDSVRVLIDTFYSLTMSIIKMTSEKLLQVLFTFFGNTLDTISMSL